jgi:hypothetical protein
MKIGLVGFPGSGKTTVFNALTGLSAETGYGAARGKTNLGVVKVPDARVDALANLYKPKKTTYAEIAFSDVAGAPAGSEGQGLDEKTLAAMREMDALCHVVRGFPGPSGEAPRPLAEAKDFEVEMNLSDLILIEKRLERVKKEKGKASEQALLEKLKVQLDNGLPLRGLQGLDAADLVAMSGFRFLVVLAGAVEMDIAQMSPEEQKEFVTSLGLTEPAAGRFIRAAYALIDLISLLTAGEDECRAWPIRAGTTAQKAAGKIHSDIERGFIRAEVMRWDDLCKLGSEAKCREAAKLRLEGKEYVVADGDVINFRFNV